MVKYYDYIRSEAWQQKRREFYSSKMYKHLKGNGKWNCYCCGRDDVRLDLHHRTYKRLGNENIATDLIPVCRSCHDEIHTKEKSGVQLWAATKSIRKKYLGKVQKKIRQAKRKEIVERRRQKRNLKKISKKPN